MVIKNNIINWSSQNLTHAIESLNENDADDFSLLYLDEILSALFVSISTGEYYFINLKKCLLDLEKNYIEKISTSNNKVLKDKKEIELLIKFYLFFIQNIEDSLNKNFDNKKFNFELEYYYKKNDFIYEINQSQDTLLFWLFIVNLKISFLDEGYVVNDENITLLWEMDHLLQLLISNRNNSYFDLLTSTKLRGNVLLYKIIKRNEKSNTESKFLIYNSSNDLKEYIISQKAEEIINKIDNHYFQKSIEKEQLLIDVEKKISNDTIKIIEVVTFTKFCRKNIDFKEDEIKKVKLLIEKLKAKYNRIKSSSINQEYLDKINEFPCFTVLEHLINLEFSLKCNEECKKLNEKFNFNNLEKTFNELKKSFTKSELDHNAIESKIPNFIIKKTYLTNLIKILEVSNEQEIENLNDDKNDFHKLISDIYEEGYKTFFIFKKAVIFWETQRLMPLYLEIENCEDNGVFMDSSFVLPSNYQDFLSKNEKNLEELEKFKVLLDKVIPKNIRDNYKKVFENEVKDYKISLITIIGLYASFITYVLGNISLLKVFLYHSIGSVLAFMLVFGIVLSFFVISLKLLFASFNNFKNYIIAWFIIILLTIGSALYLIDEFKDIKISKETYKKIEYETSK